MKRFLSLTILLSIMLCVLVACGKEDSSNKGSRMAIKSMCLQPFILYNRL